MIIHNKWSNNAFQDCATAPTLSESFLWPTVYFQFTTIHQCGRPRMEWSYCSSGTIIVVAIYLQRLRWILYYFLIGFKDQLVWHMNSSKVKVKVNFIVRFLTYFCPNIQILDNKALNLYVFFTSWNLKLLKKTIWFVKIAHHVICTGI